MSGILQNLPPGHTFGGSATDEGGLCTWSLANIIAELCQRANMDPRTVDAGSLFPIRVRGYAVINTYPASSALLELSQVFFFDPSNYDGIVHFFPRGRDTVRTLTEDVMVVTNADDDAVQEDQQRQDSISVPRVLNLNYYDINGGLSTDKQSSTRAGDRRATGESSLDTTVLFSADEAKRVVFINHKVMAEEQKGTLTLSLSDEYLDLSIAENIFVQYRGMTKRVRITQMDMDDGQQAYTLVFDRQSCYTANLQGYPPQVAPPPPNRIPGDTLVQPLDIPILSDKDDFFGCYLAVSGELPGWRGCTVDISLDGGASYIDSTEIIAQAVIGELEAPVSAASPDIPDVWNTLEISVQQDDTELQGATFTDLLNNVNRCIVGDEIMQFGDVDQDSEHAFSLSTLIRGRKQTAAIAHSIGERFVALDRRYISYIPCQLSWLGKTITLRATSFGLSTDEGIVTSFVFQGRSQIEFQPKYLAAAPSGTNLDVTWQGVGRIGGGAQIAMGAYFVGYHFYASDGTTTVEVDLLTQAYTLDTTAFSGPITIRVSQRNQFTGLGPYAEIIV